MKTYIAISPANTPPAIAIAIFASGVSNPATPLPPEEAIWKNISLAPVKSLTPANENRMATKIEKLPTIRI